MLMSLPAHNESAVPAGARYHGLRVTNEEYENLEDDGFKYDMIDGVLYVTPSPTYEHGKRASRFELELGIFLRSHPLGEIVHEIDVFLPDGGDALRPDLHFILNERMHIVRDRVHGAPDLICEVLSPSTKKRDLGVKADRYLACGVQEYWILDPIAKSVEMWIPRGDKAAWEKVSADVLESRLLPGFRIAARELFA